MSQLWIKVLVIVAVVFAVNRAAPMSDTDAIIKDNTPENLERLANLGKDDLAEELSGQYQGDIIMSSEQLRDYESGESLKTGLLNEKYRWPNGVVPFRVRTQDFTSAQVDYIYRATKALEQATCLRFIPYDASNHTDFVTVMGIGSGCFSSVGRHGGEQFLNLQPYKLESGCFRLYTIVHEFIHAVGFYHMQSATERDEYVQILFDLLQRGTESNFNKYGFDVITNYGIEYDYGSVMHYGPTAFSINGSHTIIPLKDMGDETMGQRVRMSNKDTLRLNRMYCGEPITTTVSLETTASLPVETTISYETTSSQSFPNQGTSGQAAHGIANNLLSNILSGFRR